MSRNTYRFEGHVRKEVGIRDGGSTNEINFPKPVIASLGTDMYIQESRFVRRCESPPAAVPGIFERMGEVVGS